MTIKELCDAVLAERDPDDTLAVMVEQWISRGGYGDVAVSIYSISRSRFYTGHTGEQALAAYRARNVPASSRRWSPEDVGEIPPPQTPEPPAAPPGPPDPRPTPDYPF